MRIALIGWNGHHNAGDDRMTECVVDFFQPHVTDVFDLNCWATPEVFKQYDWILIGGGDLWKRDLGRKTFELIADPPTRLGMIGIGVVRNDWRLFLHTYRLLRNAKFVLVRDKESYDLLWRHPRVVVGPDLTWLSLYPLVSHYCQSDPIGLNARPWPVGFWKGYRIDWESVINNPRWKFEVKPIPLHAEQDHHLLRHFCENVPDKFNPTLLDGISVLVGMRFHSLIFAAQRGIPFIGICYHPKCWRFMRAIGLEEFALDPKDVGQLPDLVERALKEANRIRSVLIEKRDVFTREVTHILSMLKQRMEDGQQSDRVRV